MLTTALLEYYFGKDMCLPSVIAMLALPKKWKKAYMHSREGFASLQKCRYIIPF